MPAMRKTYVANSGPPTLPESWTTVADRVPQMSLLTNAMPPTSQSTWAATNKADSRVSLYAGSTSASTQPTSVASMVLCGWGRRRRRRSAGGSYCLAAPRHIAALCGFGLCGAQVFADELVGAAAARARADCARVAGADAELTASLAAPHGHPAAASVGPAVAHARLLAPHRRHQGRRRARLGHPARPRRQRRLRLVRQAGERGAQGGGARRPRGRGRRRQLPADLLQDRQVRGDVREDLGRDGQLVELRLPVHRGGPVPGGGRVWRRVVQVVVQEPELRAEQRVRVQVPKVRAARGHEEVEAGGAARPLGPPAPARARAYARTCILSARAHDGARTCR